MKTMTLDKAPVRGPAERVKSGKAAKKLITVRRILVPIDFSKPSLAAIGYASKIATRFGAEVNLVHVFEPQPPLVAMNGMPLYLPDPEVGTRARAHLERTAKRHGIPLRAEHIHVKEGRPFEEICRLASKLEIDLIVIPTRGNTGLKHLILGSTAERIVRYSPCPVLVVHSAVGGSRAKRNGATPAAIKIKKILVPIDFSACSLKGLAYAAALARQFNASLILFNSVHVEYYLTNDEYGRYDLPEVIEESERASRRQMKELVEKTDWEGLKVQSLLESGHPGNRICQQALTQRADLIVTSTHGTTGLKHILLGSTAEYVVRTATVPVLVVPSHERPAV